jgi:RimJ/RimL family protein N-acetyltransferase
VPAIRTERLVLRRWLQRDREPFAAMNADPEVMAHFPAPLTREESDALVDRIEAGFAEHGFGLWALEVRSAGAFIGFTGLAVPSFEAAFTPAVEIGWRLQRPAWGQGYATEAARAALAVAFDQTGMREVVSFTSTVNDRSQAVMPRDSPIMQPRCARYRKATSGPPAACPEPHRGRSSKIARACADCPPPGEHLDPDGGAARVQRREHLQAPVTPVLPAEQALGLGLRPLSPIR